MAESKSDFAKLTPEERQALAKKYADRLLYALTEEGDFGDGVGTIESEVSRIAKELQKIGSSDFVDSIDDIVREKYPEGLREVLIDDYSFDDEDAILNAFGYPTEDVFGTSLQESQATKGMDRSDYAKFGPGGTIDSNEYTDSEAVVADENIGSGNINPTYSNAEKKGSVDINNPAAKSEEEAEKPKPVVQQAPKPTLDNPEGLLASANNMQKFDPDNLTVGSIANSLKAESRRQFQDQIDARRRSDRIQKIFDDREADLKESWARSRTGKRDGRRWEDLDEDTKSEMRGRFMDAKARSAYTDEKYKAYKERKNPLEKEYQRKLKALQEERAEEQRKAEEQSRAMPPQDPFTEETKTDAMLTQPKGPESFELFFAEDPKNEPGYASSDSKPFSVDTTSKEGFGPRRKFIFTDPTRPEKPREPESFELFMPQNESGYASADSKPFSVDTTSKDKFGPRRDLMTRPFPQPKSEPLNLFNITDQDVANTKQQTAKQNAFADLEEAKQAEGLRSQIADIRGQIQNQQDILDLKNKADRELDARYAAENAAKAARNAAYKEAQRMAKEKNIADTKKYHYNTEIPVYGRRNDGTLGLMYDPNSYKAMKERSQVMGDLKKYGESDPFGSWMEEEKKRRKNQNIFG